MVARRPLHDASGRVRIGHSRQETVVAIAMGCAVPGLARRVLSQVVLSQVVLSQVVLSQVVLSQVVLDKFR